MVFLGRLVVVRVVVLIMKEVIRNLSVVNVVGLILFVVKELSENDLVIRVEKVSIVKCF